MPSLLPLIPLLKSIRRSLLLFCTHWSQSETILLRSFQDMGEVCTTTQRIYFDILRLPRLLAAQTEFEHVRMNCLTDLPRLESRFSCAPRVFLLVMAVMFFFLMCSQPSYGFHHIPQVAQDACRGCFVASCSSKYSEDAPAVHVCTFLSRYTY